MWLSNGCVCVCFGGVFLSLYWLSIIIYGDKCLSSLLLGYPPIYGGGYQHTDQHTFISKVVFSASDIELYLDG